MEFDKKVIVDVDGSIATGKQFDLDLKLPEDDRNVVYGIIRDSHGKPVSDAVVKLVEGKCLKGVDLHCEKECDEEPKMEYNNNEENCDC